MSSTTNFTWLLRVDRVSDSINQPLLFAGGTLLSITSFLTRKFSKFEPPSRWDNILPLKVEVARVQPQL